MQADPGSVTPDHKAIDSAAQGDLQERLTTSEKVGFSLLSPSSLFLSRDVYYSLTAASLAAAFAIFAAFFASDSMSSTTFRR